MMANLNNQGSWWSNWLGRLMVKRLESGSSWFAGILLWMGANPNATNNKGISALTLATKLNEVTLVERLIESGASIDQAESSAGEPLLFTALQNDAEEAFNYLITSQLLDITKCNSQGENILHLLVRKNRLDLTKQLGTAIVKFRNWMTGALRKEGHTSGELLREDAIRDITINTFQQLATQKDKRQHTPLQLDCELHPFELNFLKSWVEKVWELTSVARNRQVTPGSELATDKQHLKVIPDMMYQLLITNIKQKQASSHLVHTLIRYGALDNLDDQQKEQLLKTAAASLNVAAVQMLLSWGIPVKEGLIEELPAPVRPQNERNNVLTIHQDTITQLRTSPLEPQRNYLIDQLTYTNKLLQDQEQRFQANHAAHQQILTLLAQPAHPKLSLFSITHLPPQHLRRTDNAELALSIFKNMDEELRKILQTLETENQIFDQRMINNIQGYLKLGANPNLVVNIEGRQVNLLSWVTNQLISSRKISHDLAITLLQHLFQYGVDLNLPSHDQKNSCGALLIRWAVQNKDLTLAQQLIDHGVAIDAPLISKHTAAPTTLLTSLITESNIINASDWRRHLAKIEWCLQHGANPNAWISLRDGSILAQACDIIDHSKRAAVVDLLLDHQAQANLIALGRPPLMIAIERKDNRLAKKLLEHGADANMFEIVLPTDQIDLHGKISYQTPLHLAVQEEATTITELLLREYRADPQLIDENGQSPAQLAENGQNPKIRQLFTIESKSPDNPETSQNLVDGKNL